MMRVFVIALIVIAGLAIGVYRAKLGAQDNEKRIESLRGEIRDAQEEISVLKAEEAYLARPERIGPLASERLGLAPSAPEQFTAPEMLSRRLGEEGSIPTEASSVSGETGASLP
jgi:cell division protein FtsL